MERHVIIPAKPVDLHGLEIGEAEGHVRRTARHIAVQNGSKLHRGIGILVDAIVVLQARTLKDHGIGETAAQQVLDATEGEFHGIDVADVGGP